MDHTQEMDTSPLDMDMDIEPEQEDASAAATTDRQRSPPADEPQPKRFKSEETQTFDDDTTPEIPSTGTPTEVGSQTVADGEQQSGDAVVSLNEYVLNGKWLFEKLKH